MQSSKSVPYWHSDLVKQDQKLLLVTWPKVEMLILSYLEKRRVLFMAFAILETLPMPLKFSR